MEWEAVNPVPPELKLAISILNSIHCFITNSLWQAFPGLGSPGPLAMVDTHTSSNLPVSFVYSANFTTPPNYLIRQIREELYTQPYSSIRFAAHRNSIYPRDNYHHKSLILTVINWILVYIWFPFLRTESIRRRAEDWTFDLIQREDENTDFADLAPVSSAMNMVASYNSRRS